MNYDGFLHGKVVTAPESGIDVKPEELSRKLKPHQRDAVIWALKGGRRGLFESFGLGKTAQELEYCRLIVRHQGGKALIVLPLGVRQEFKRDAVELLGMAPPEYVRSMEEAERSDASILMTNYERVRDGDIDPRAFTATVLDEASVLRSFGSKTYQTFLDKFQGVPYKLVCTATPSPNRYKELIHYAGFLEVMDTGQALTRFFQRDSTKANNLTLYPHKEKEFWLWVSTWALMITKPSDLGYSDEGYALPPLKVVPHVIRDQYGQSVGRDGQVELLRKAAVSLSEAAREKRDTIGARVAMAKEIIDSDPEAHFILWHDLEAEREAIQKAIPEAVPIYGTQDLETREANTMGFSDGKFRILSTKKELSGSGCNFQRHCHRAIFVGIDYEFNDFIQAVHRIYRFLQTEEVTIDILYTESEQEIYRALMEMLSGKEQKAYQDAFAALLPENMESLSPEMQKQVYQYAEQIARDSALAGRGVEEYSPAAWVQKAQEAAESGIGVDNFLKLKEQLSALEPIKDPNGKTTETAAQQKRNALFENEELTPEQKQAIDLLLISGGDSGKVSDYTTNNAYLRSQMNETEQARYDAAAGIFSGMTAEEYQELAKLAKSQKAGEETGTEKKQAVLQALMDRGMNRREAYAFYALAKAANPGETNWTDVEGACYAGLSDSGKTKYQAVREYFVELPVSDFAYIQDILSGVEGDRDQSGKTVSGSLKRNKLAVLMGLGMTAAEAQVYYNLTK